MSIADIKYFNLLIHYGLDFKNNFNELLDEALLEVLKDPNHNTLSQTHPIKIYETRYFELDSQLYLTGLLYKSADLKWETIPDAAGEPVVNPGNKPVMPYARYVISLSDHRIFWITKRGLSKSPSIFDFCYFIKRKTLDILKEKYRLHAELFWAAISDDLKEIGFKNKNHFVNGYLKENKLNFKLFEVRAVPEVSTEAINSIIDDKKYIIKSASFFPHMNNVTDDDCEELFTKADKIAKEAESEATINLKPKSSEEGIKKDTVKQILNINQNHNLLKFSLSLKNIEDKKEKSLIVSNVKDSDTIIAKTGALDGEPMNTNILESIKNKFPDIIGNDPVSESVKEKVEESGIGKVDVE